MVQLFNCAEGAALPGSAAADCCGGGHAHVARGTWETPGSVLPQLLAAAALRIATGRAAPRVCYAACAPSSTSFPPPPSHTPIPTQQAEHRTAGPVPDHLRARGYVLDQDEAPKTKIENPFDLLNLADE